MTELGKLSVQLKSASDFFVQTAPIEVRDSKMRMIKRAQYERQLDLPVGLYEVSAVLEDGRRPGHQAVQQILTVSPPGQQIYVELD